MKMGTVIGKLDRRYDSIAVGDTVGTEGDGASVTYTVDSFGGLVGSDGSRLSPKEWKGNDFEILAAGERRPEYPDNEPEVVMGPVQTPAATVSDVEDEARRVTDEQAEERLAAMENALADLRRELDGLRDNAARLAETRKAAAPLSECPVEDLTAELARRGYVGTVSRIVRLGD